MRRGATTLGLLLVLAAGCKDRSAESGSAGASTTAPGAGATGDIVIGAYLSMTGSTATFGQETQRGAQLAIDETNAAGGIRGRQVRLVTIDDRGQADEAGNAVSRLIDVEKAVALLGEVQSSLSLVGGRIAQRRRVPMVSPSSTNTQVTEIGDFVFRVCFIDPFQGTVMARFARENLRLSRVAILRDVRSDYSIGLARAFTEAFTAGGGTIVADQSYNAGDTDFSAQLTAIKSAGPDGLFIPGYYTEVGNIARQARRLGLTVPLLGGDGWDSPELRTIGGPDIVGSYYSNHFAPDRVDDRTRGFIERYRARHGETPSGLAALGYDAALVLLDAMRRARELTPVAIRDALVTANVEGVTGRITFDEKRNPIKPAVVLRVTAEGDRFEAQIDPPTQPATTGGAGTGTGSSPTTVPPPSGASTTGAAAPAERPGSGGGERVPEARDPAAAPRS
ncbi:MAG: ABC transporter substrate-binding protein [Myxococcota bacterium]|nr:ABC transporter substrate-binding protein [Myxococcota bacterium]MDW8361254.1 ABC transporter substrate-binding protein [Myxococcales bacterium]